MPIGFKRDSEKSVRRIAISPMMAVGLFPVVFRNRNSNKKLIELQLKKNHENE